MNRMNSRYQAPQARPASSVEGLMAQIAANPTNPQLIRRCVEKGMCLGKMVGGPQDGQMVWTKPGPPETVAVDGDEYFHAGVIPNNQVEAWAAGFFLHAYHPVAIDTTSREH